MVENNRINVSRPSIIKILASNSTSVQRLEPVAESDHWQILRTRSCAWFGAKLIIGAIIWQLKSVMPVQCCEAVIIGLQHEQKRSRVGSPTDPVRRRWPGDIFGSRPMHDCLAWLGSARPAPVVQGHGRMVDRSSRPSPPTAMSARMYATYSRKNILVLLGY